MSEPKPELRETTRLRRLVQLLVVFVLLWGVVTVVRRLIPPAPLTLARTAVESGRFDEAVALYRRHLATRPDDWGVHAELGMVLEQSDRPQALAEFRKVPPDSDAYLDARRQIVSICLTSERLQEAEEVLLELGKRIPDDFLTQFTLAQLYFQQHRPQTGLPFAQKSVALKRDDAAAQFLLAEILDDLNRIGEMIAPLERVVELQLDNYAAHLNLAYAYADAGQAAASRREAEWCLIRNPEDINARRFLARAARDLGEREEAKLEIERALALAPDDLECRLLEAEMLLFEQQATEALQRLKPLYEPHSNDRRLAALLARAAAAAGLADEAETYRKQVQKLSE